MSFVESLSEVLPAESVVGVGTDHDFESDAPGVGAVITPGSTEEVARLMAWANRNHAGVLPLGAAREWPASVDRPRADRHCVVLSTARLTGVETYEPADLTLTAGAGTPVHAIDETLRAHAQWMPFDPPWMEDRTLGGLAASGESGPLWAGYGELRNHVLGMTVVTGDGRVLRLGGRVVKNVAGYDLIKAMVGSRGRLAVVTSVCIRAFPVPAVDRILGLAGSSPGALVTVAQKAVSAPVLPASTILVDELPALGGRAALVIRLHGAAATVDADQRTLERHLGVRLVALEDAPVGPEGGAMSQGSGTVLESLRDRGADAPACIVVSALPSRMSMLVDALDDLGPLHLLLDCCSGTARVGASTLPVGAVERVRAIVEQLGGALRVERWPDDGSARPASTSPSVDELDLARSLEEAFDPGGVLWPSRP
jgi:glycolate oxidase FAD binding subunit